MTHRALRAGLRAGLVASIAIGAIASPGTHAQQAAEPGEHTMAIWRQQQLRLDHFSEHTHYTCAELAARVTAILRALGAHSTMRSEGRCSDFSRRQSLSITLLHPVEANLENLKAATTFDAVQQLLAHVQNEPLPTASDLERFPAVWRRVSLTRARVARVSSADCSLLYALKDQVFPWLSVRIVRNGFRCTRDVTNFAPSVIAEALVPLAG